VFSVVRLLLTGALLSLAVPAFAMTVTIENRAPLRAGLASARPFYTIRMTGMIERGDAEALRKALEKVKAATSIAPDGTLATAELSSSGGDVYEGVAIGYVFRQFAVGTLVRATDVCFSACALAFLGGSTLPPGAFPAPWRSIEFGGQVGFHNVWLNRLGLRNSSREEAPNAAIAGFDVARGGASLLIRYVTDMGIDAGFAARLLGRPIDEFDYIATAGSFIELQTCLTQPVAVTVSVEQQADNICSNAIGPAGRSGGGKVRPTTAHDMRLALLREVERRSPASAANNRFVARFRAAMAAGEEKALSDLYEGLRAAGLPLLDLSGMIYDVAPTPATLRQSCKVSLSTGDPDIYDLVMVGPKGLSAPAHAAPARCRWMARHGPADLINPSRHAAASSLTTPAATPVPKPARPPE